MGHFLGIDAGTSGIRACVINEQLEVMGEASQPLPPSRMNGSEIEQQPADWWLACCDLLDDLFSRLEPASITALAIDGTSASSLLCNSVGEPLTAALMYNDARATQQAKRLHKLTDKNSVVLGATSSLAKLLWFVDQGLAGKNAHFCHQSDWLTGHFLNNYGLSDENNCLKLGYDAENRCWPPWLPELGLPAGLLPQVHPAGECLGYVSKDMQERFGLSARCRVSAGTTDSTASCIAAGLSSNSRPGEAVTVLGSTLVVKILSEKQVSSAEHGVYSHRLGNLWLVGGASNSGGAVLQQYFNDSQLAELSQHIDPYADSGLNYYPLPSVGERFPVNDPALEPRLSPRPANDVQFLHGLLESISRIEAAAYSKLNELGAPAPIAIRSIGGGANNPAWLSMRERITGIPMKSAVHEQAACGAAQLALQCSNNAT